jgi:hypothetical protein
MIAQMNVQQYSNDEKLNNKKRTENSGRFQMNVADRGEAMGDYTT